MEANRLCWNDYSSYIRATFGERVQKISVNAGFTCPNRDGRISYDGCIYCTNKSFSPFYCNSGDSITEQLIKGIDFFSPKYQSQKYLAYFQTYTNTYASVEVLKERFDEALRVPNVIGLVVSTRPDCVNDEILGLIAEYASKYYVEIEYGLESTLDASLEKINRGHTFADAVNAVNATAKFGIMCGLHLIIGLPGECEEDFYNHARKVSSLPIKTLKLHQMQVLKGTRLEKMYLADEVKLADLSLPNYVRIVANFLELLNPDIIVERFTSESPRDMLVYPYWEGKKNFEVVHKINSYMMANGMFQGRRFLK
ncbi:MAG: TIGR01212 family radical SAM protein [Bacteroidales bacterium]|nr:TIGR01212 family radical SAM protein [Bacteroidales bacterium]